MKDKRELLEALLERGMVMVTLDSRRPGVDVPPRLAGTEQLRLNLSYRFGLPLEVSPWGVRTTLTFGGVSHDCKLPWSAIYLVASHVTSEQFVFPDDVPVELIPASAAAAAEVEEEEDHSLPTPVPTVRPRLTLVSARAEPEEGDSSDEAAAGASSEVQGDNPPEASGEQRPGGAAGRSHLRRIK